MKIKLGAGKMAIVAGLSVLALSPLGAQIQRSSASRAAMQAIQVDVKASPAFSARAVQQARTHLEKTVRRSGSRVLPAGLVARGSAAPHLKMVATLVGHHNRGSVVQATADVAAIDPQSGRVLAVRRGTGSVRNARLVKRGGEFGSALSEGDVNAAMDQAIDAAIDQAIDAALNALLAQMQQETPAPVAGTGVPAVVPAVPGAPNTLTPDVIPSGGQAEVLAPPLTGQRSGAVGQRTDTTRLLLVILLRSMRK